MDIAEAVTVILKVCDVDIPSNKRKEINPLQRVIPFLSSKFSFEVLYDWKGTIADMQFLEHSASESKLVSQIGRFVFEGEFDTAKEVISAAEIVYGDFNSKKVNYLSTEKGRNPPEEFKNWITHRGGKLDYDEAWSCGPFPWHRYLLED